MVVKPFSIMQTMMYLGTRTAVCDGSKAKLFNLYFHSVLNKASQPIPEYNTTQQSHEFLSSFTIAEVNVFQAPIKLDTSK